VFGEDDTNYLTHLNKPTQLTVVSMHYALCSLNASMEHSRFGESDFTVDSE
jgi:hypothetical protein